SCFPVEKWEQLGKSALREATNRVGLGRLHSTELKSHLPIQADVYLTHRNSPDLALETPKSKRSTKSWGRKIRCGSFHFERAHLYFKIRPWPTASNLGAKSRPS